MDVKKLIAVFDAPWSSAAAVPARPAKIKQGSRKLSFNKDENPE